MTRKWQAEGVQQLAKDLVAERDALAAELEATQATLNAAMEGRRHAIERAMRAEAALREVAERLSLHHCVVRRDRPADMHWEVEEALALVRAALKSEG